MKTSVLIAFLFVPYFLIGQDWTSQTSGTREHLLGAYFTDSTRGWVAGSGGAILHTTNGGTTWLSQTSGTMNSLVDIHFIDASMGWAVGDVGTILHTTDGGATWSNQTSGTTDDVLVGVSFIDGNRGWVVGYGTILHTRNGGAMWENQTGVDALLNDVCFTDENRGWVVGSNGTILHTTNGGTGWESQTSGTGYWLNGVYFIDSNTGWVVGVDGTILRTTDGGATWVFVSMGGSVLSGVYFTDANIGWVVGWDGTILHTIDGGETWMNETSPATTDLWDVHFTNAGLGWAAGESGTILHFQKPVTVNASVFPTSGDGNFDYTFEIMNNSNSSQTFDIWTEVVDRQGIRRVVAVLYVNTLAGGRSQSKITMQHLGENRAQGGYTYVAYVGTYPNEIMDSSSATYTKTNLAKLQGSSQESIPARTRLLGSYPNPFNPSTTIHYDLSQDAHVKLKVYNMLGQVVRTLADNFQPAGYRAVLWDGRNDEGVSVSSGVYIYRLETGIFAGTRRMLMLK